MKKSVLHHSLLQAEGRNEYLILMQRSSSHTTLSQRRGQKNEDKEILKNFSKEEIEEIVHAVREHRASTGNPQTVIAKIISDADKASDGTNSAFQRAYHWGKKHLPNVNHEGQLLRAAYHLKVNFGEEGTGRRLYFPESEERIVKMYEPIFNALEVYDMERMEGFLK